MVARPSVRKYFDARQGFRVSAWILKDVWHHPRLSRAHHCDDRVCYDLGNAFQALLTHTVRRSVITLTMQPAPAISTSFSCQLSKTLIACPPPSPPPLECIWENPVDCGD